MRILALLAFLATIAILAYTASRAHRRQLAASHHPTLNHECAIRVLDRIVAADEVLPSLPSDLVNEAKSVIARHYGQKEFS